jgi:excisionase family DNA binding protein
MSEFSQSTNACEPRDRLLTGDEVAEILKCSRSFAYQLMRQREIPTVRLGRAVRVRRQDLDNFIVASLSTPYSTLNDLFQK